MSRKRRTTVAHVLLVFLVVFLLAVVCAGWKWHGPPKTAGWTWDPGNAKEAISSTQLH